MAQARRRDLKNGLRPVPSRGPASKFLSSGQESTSTGESIDSSMSNNSHSVDTQDHKPPPLSEKKVPAVLACIAEWFPQAFVAEKYLPHRPLKIGIHVDLKARCPALSERKRGAVLHWYVTRTMYLRACVAGAPRVAHVITRSRAARTPTVEAKADSGGLDIPASLVRRPAP